MIIDQHLVVYGGYIGLGDGFSIDLRCTAVVEYNWFKNFTVAAGKYG